MHLFNVLMSLSADICQNIVSWTIKHAYLNKISKKLHPTEQTFTFLSDNLIYLCLFTYYILAIGYRLIVGML